MRQKRTPASEPAPIAVSRRRFITAVPWMLVLVGCKDFRTLEGSRIDRSKISDPDVLTCVKHVEGYIDACYHWEKDLPRKASQPLDGLPSGICAFVVQAGGGSYPDFEIAGERFKPIAEYFWTGSEWKNELGSFGLRQLKHDPDDEWPISADRIADAAVEVIVSISDFMDRDQRLQRVYRLEKVTEGDATSAGASAHPWRIRTIFDLFEPGYTPDAVPSPPAALAAPDRPQLPAGVSAVSTGPIKTTVRLRPYPDPQVSAQSNNIGGPFFFNQLSSWPRCELHNTSMVGMVQLNKSDISELPFRDQEEVLQVFWCPFDHDDGHYCPLVSTRWLKKNQLTDTGKPNPKITRRGMSDNLPVACRLYPHKVTELPGLDYRNYEEVSKRVVDWLKKSDEYEFPKNDVAPTDYEGLYRFVGPASGTKVMGYANWIQDTEIPSCDSCSEPMTLMLTMASAEWENGNLLRPKEFGVNVPYNTTGLMLGDVGNVYIFICAKCKERPVKRVFQCS